MTKLLRFVFVLGIGIGIGGATTSAFQIDTASGSPQTVPDFNPNRSLAPLVESLSGAVVNISISVDRSTMGTLMPFGYMPESPLEAGQGSGFLISEDGYILTNHHVIDGADSVTVRLANEEEYTGTVVGFDDSIDVALLKIEHSAPFPYIELGNSDAVRVGDYAVAIGNPFGLSHTVTMGIISAKERVIGSGPYDDYLQTDASINPGNSGGPLFNLQGEAIGINTAINPRAQGIGFSLPINKVKSILDDLKEHGRPSRGWLGLGLQPLEGEQQGALVREVYPKTPAFKAGLEVGDIITSFDGKAVESVDEVIRLVGSYRAGDTVGVEIIRGKKQKELTVELGKRPSQEDLSRGTFLQDSTEDWGIQTTPTQGFGSKTSYGLVIIQISKNSPLRGILQLGDILLEIDGNPVGRSSLSSVSPNDNLEFKIWRQGNIVTIDYPN